ncbi:MAG TPA: glycosyltransferase family 4 protein, partial [Oligoflexia bacterium]|nr:glycosyltransferase family 4 protein [Oligoflexia bacterium]
MMLLNSIRDKLRALTENSSAAQLYDVTAFTTHSSRLGPHIKLVRSVTEVVLDPVFLSADIHIFEFGVYTELFNAIYCSRPGQTKVVHYHNITPPELVPPEKREITYKSLEQKVNLLAADQIWCVSEINRMDLLEYGIAADKLSLLPLPVSFVHQPPPVRSPERKNRVDLLYVGRLVPSKGILDVLRALCALRQTGPLRASLKLVGSPTFSDQEYISELHSFLAKHDLTGHVQFAGEVSDQELLRCYDEADALVIPSYHEGFCVPVVEA